MIGLMCEKILGDSFNGLLDGWLIGFWVVV